MNAITASLTPTRRRELRALAHALNPVVSISKKGLTEPVLKEIDRCLTTHELIKVRVYDCEREQREALLAELCAALDAAPVQHIGHLLVVWREKPTEAASTAPVQPARPRRVAPKLTKKAAAAKTDRAARARPIAKGKPRRPTRT
ncbi:MAG: YhbY family RNA-binding protein [Sterolibacterium sp.]|nr:YhbY family RNA-binding protein [Sterolibacterium sp.]